MPKELNKIELRTVQEAVKSGFTFRGDAHFRTWEQADRTIRSLLALHILRINHDDDGARDYRPTQLAHDIIKYGSLKAALA